MTLPHQKLREIVFLYLFAQASNDLDQTALLNLIMEQLKISRSNALKGLEEAAKIKSKFSEIDQLLNEVALSYDFERVQTIEKTALRLGVYELFFAPDLPPKVAIAEALRLTKKFGTPAATAFVNALLDALYKRSCGEKVDQAKITTSIESLQLSEEHAKQISESIPPSNPE